MRDREQPVWSVEFINESLNTGDVCVYQALAHPPANSSALVWMTKAAAPTTHVLFTWTEEFHLYWCERDPHVRGPAAITASQSWPADPGGDNRITYGFRDLREGPNEGKLYIDQDRKVTRGGVEVGIGMSGFPAHVLPAQPNITTIFSTEVTYRIAFGTFEQSQSLDVTELFGSVELIFPKNVRSVTATLDRDNLWTIKSAPRRKRKPAPRKSRVR